MKKLVRWTVIVVSVALAISCASAPAKAPAKAPAGVAPEAELAEAKKLQKLVDTYGLGEYAPQEYAAAVKDLEAGEETYGKDNAASKQSLDKAIAGFNAVIKKGGPQFLAKIRAECEASKKAADDAKAPVAVKDDYAKAKVVYDRANKTGIKDIPSAVKDYSEAKGLFDDAAALALEKRRKAQQAMDETDKGLVESGQKATDAEQSLKDEGFGDAGAQ
jgi:hypothetical protein